MQIEPKLLSKEYLDALEKVASHLNEAELYSKVMMLLAHIAALDLELKEVREANECIPELIRDRQATAHRCKEYDVQARDYTIRIEKLRAHIAALTPVVEAAVAFVERERDNEYLPHDIDGCLSCALIIAVDALEEAKEAGRCQ